MYFWVNKYILLKIILFIKIVNLQILIEKIEEIVLQEILDTYIKYIFYQGDSR